MKILRETIAAHFILQVEWTSIGWPCCEFYWSARAVSECLTFLLFVIIFRSSLTI